MHDAHTPDDDFTEDWPPEEFPESAGSVEPGASSAAEAAGGSRGDAAPEKEPEERRPEPRRVFVAAPTFEARDTYLFRLARLYHLDVHRGSLLGERAGEQLETAAALLTVVLLFEFAMWGLLFNTIAYTSPWTTGPLTPLAFGFGGLFAIAVFVYEKSLVTTDTTLGRGFWRSLSVLAAFAMRIALILCSAQATAQPFELMFFNGQIEQRLRQETVLAEALRQTKSQAVDKALAKPKDRKEIEDALSRLMVGVDAQQAAAKAGAAETSLGAADAAVTLATARLGEARAQILARQQQLATAQRADPRDDEEIRRAQARLAAARAALVSATGNLESARLQQRMASTAMSVAKTHKQNADKEFRDAAERDLKDELARAKAFDARAELRKAWIDQVQAAPYGQAIRNPVTQIVLEWNTADFVERLAILEDVRHGRSPRWPLSSKVIKADAIALFQLPDSESGERDPRSDDWREMTRHLYYVAFIIALLIPSLTVGFKFWLISPELRAYYSSAAQERAANAEALEIRRACRREDDPDGRH